MNCLLSAMASTSNERSMPKTSKEVKEDMEGWSISRWHKEHENRNRSAERHSDLRGHSV